MFAPRDYIDCPQLLPRSSSAVFQPVLWQCCEGRKVYQTPLVPLALMRYAYLRPVLCHRRPGVPLRASIPLRQTRNETLIRSRYDRHHFSLQAIPAVLLPPVVFTGLLVTLWTYKCLMMIVFQNKIIYMPSIPPFSRSEKISDYTSQCVPVVWEEIRIKSLDGTPLALAKGQMSNKSSRGKGRPLVVLYFQG